jgi:hypothetical protein
LGLDFAQVLADPDPLSRLRPFTAIEDAKQALKNVTGVKAHESRDIEIELKPAR